jgi:Bacterial transglutaminase-like N-terminal region
MRLQINHRTTHRYATGVSLQPHRLLVTPRNSHTLSTVSRSLTFSPTAEVDWAQDVFGNLIATATFSHMTRELIITSEAVVEQAASAWPIFRIAPEAHSYPFNYAAYDARDLGALAQSEGASLADVAVWARSFVRGP